MRRANRRATHGALFTALVLLLISGSGAAQICPDNFLDIPESDVGMTATKQGVGTLCIGREVTFRGTLFDIASRRDEFELHLASLATGHANTVIMRDAPDADMSKLQKARR